MQVNQLQPGQVFTYGNGVVYICAKVKRNAVLALCYYQRHHIYSFDPDAEVERTGETVKIVTHVQVRKGA